MDLIFGIRRPNCTHMAILNQRKVNSIYTIYFIQILIVTQKRTHWITKQRARSHVTIWAHAWHTDTCPPHTLDTLTRRVLFNTDCVSFDIRQKKKKTLQESPKILVYQRFLKNWIAAWFSDFFLEQDPGAQRSSKKRLTIDPSSSALSPPPKKNFVDEKRDPLDLSTQCQLMIL